MSNYTKTVDFASKDTLPSGDSGKIIKGTEFETEFDNIATAVATKADSAAPTFTGTSVFANLDISGDIDVDGTTNLDVVDIDGAVDMATTLAVAGNVDFNGDLDVDGTTNLDAVDIDGAVDFASTTAHAGNATFADNAKAIFGAGSDLQIYHNGSRSTILDSGTGALRIAGTNLEFMNAAESKFYANASDGGSFNLYYDNAAKLATTATGIDVTGVITTDGMTTSADINFGDSDKAVFGAGSDLQIYHDGDTSYISHNTTGTDLVIEATSPGDDVIVRAADDLNFRVNGNENGIVVVGEGATSLYHANSQKLATTATGIDVTGSVTMDRLGLGVAAHASAALFITTTDQHIRFSNGSELAVIDLDSDGELNIWAHGDEEVINLRTGSGSGADIVKVNSTGIDVTGSVTAKGASGGNLFLTSTDTSGATGEDLGNINFVTEDVSSGSSGTMAKISSVFESNGDNAAIKIQTGFSTGSGSPTLRDRALFASNGDVSLYEDTGTTPKLFWDASAESLGLGTSSAATSLHVTDGGTPPTISGTYLIAATSASNAGIAINAGSSSASIIAFGDSDSQDIGVIRYDHSDNSMRFNTAGETCMTIDNSGKLLIGTTHNSLYNSSTQAHAGALIDGINDNIQVARWGSTPLFVNRMSTDGSLVDFRKDGASVGSIGTSGGDLVVGTGDTTLLFDDANDAIKPRGTDGVQRDGGISLGTGGNRWKDAFLSGGVYLGGTAAANKLDYFEEGTFSPTLIGSVSGAATFTTSRANYVKIGRQVTVYVYLTNVDVSGSFSGNLKMGGLPFASTSPNNIGSQVVMTYSSIFDASSLNLVTSNISGYVASQDIIFYQGSSTTSVPTSALSGSGKVTVVSATYLADS